MNEDKEINEIDELIENENENKDQKEDKKVMSIKLKKNKMMRKRIKGFA